MPRGEFKHHCWFFAEAPNIARYCRVIWKDLWWSSDWFLPSSQISGRMYNTDVSIKCMMWKVFRSPTPCLCRYLQTIFECKWHNRARWVVLGLLQDGACTHLKKISARIGETNRLLPLSTHLFSHWSIPFGDVFLWLNSICSIFFGFPHSTTGCIRWVGVWSSHHLRGIRQLWEFRPCRGRHFLCILPPCQNWRWEYGCACACNMLGMCLSVHDAWRYSLASQTICLQMV